MLEYLKIGDYRIACETSGQGPLVVLSHGLGDSRHSYRFLAPMVAAAGYRVANVDVRGCGDSSLGWDGYSRTDIGGDLLAVVRHLGGPAVLVGHSISGGAVTVAAATAPDLVAGVIELAPFTRKQPVDVAGLLRSRRFRAGYVQMARVIVGGSLAGWLKYLDLAVPTKPADWDDELGRIEAKMSEPGRMKALQAMTRSDPGDAGPQLRHVTCPVLIVQGSADPDWADPHAEGQRTVADLPEGLGELVVIDGAGHYPHTQVPDEILTLALPFLARVLPGV